MEKKDNFKIVKKTLITKQEGIHELYAFDTKVGMDAYFD